MRTMKSNTKWMVPLALAAIVTAGCEFTQPAPPSGVTVLLTDAPGDVKQAWIRVDEIYLQGDGGRTTLLDEQTEWIDLLTLTGRNTAELVKEAYVSEGLYQQMRFRVREAVVVDNDGNVFATGSTEDLPDGVDEPTGVLQCASCETPAGLRVNLPDGGVQIGTDAKVLLVDFDVYESLNRPGRAGRSEQWVMTPLLRATDFTASGSVVGNVGWHEDLDVPQMCGDTEVSLEHFLPRLEDAGEYVANGSTDEDGAWAIDFVEPGEYTLTHVVEIEFEGYNLMLELEQEPSPVTVTSGQLTEGPDLVISSVSCDEVDDD